MVFFCSVFRKGKIPFISEAYNFGGKLRLYNIPCLGKFIHVAKDGAWSSAKLYTSTENRAIDWQDKKKCLKYIHMLVQGYGQGREHRQNRHTIERALTWYMNIQTHTHTHTNPYMAYTYDLSYRHLLSAKYKYKHFQAPLFKDHASFSLKI